MFLRESDLNEEKKWQRPNSPDPQLDQPDMDEVISPRSPRDNAGEANSPYTPNTGGANRSASPDPGNNGSRPNSGSFVSPDARRAKLLQQQKQQAERRKANQLHSGMVASNRDNPDHRRAASPLLSRHLLRNQDSPASSQLGSSSQVGSPLPASSQHRSPYTFQNVNGSSDVASPRSPYSAGPSTPNDSYSRGGGGDAAIEDLLRERQMNNGAPLSAVEQEMLAQGIAPVFDPADENGANIPADVKLDFSDMRTALTNPIPRGTTLQCKIVRNKKGIKNKLFPVYELYTDDDRFLMAAKKRSGNKTSNYLMSMDKYDLGKESANYLGKVRSNFVGTIFNIYDKGVNPKDLDESSRTVRAASVRQELGTVLYRSNILGSRGPRQMKILVPKVGRDNRRHMFRPMEPEHTMLEKYKVNDSDDMCVLVNKPPKWNDQVGAYVLNFNGRVTQASVKNFQLVDEKKPENVVLQFGRVAKDDFTMDISWPLSPLQAYAICLSSFDYKIACE